MVRERMRKTLSRYFLPKKDENFSSFLQLDIEKRFSP